MRSTPSTAPGTQALDPEVQESLACGAIVLTASRRVARTLRRAFDASARARGRTLWTPPEIFPLDTWLATLWHGALITGTQQRTILNPGQEHFLWREAIVSDTASPTLRSPDSLAAEATRAFRLLHLYSGRGRLQYFAESADSRALLRWTRIVERRCRAGNFLTSAELPAAVTLACGEGLLELPSAGLLLVDFDEFAPAYELLFDTLDRAGYPVARLHTHAPTTRTLHHTAPDDTAELNSAARWSQALLTRLPGTRIAVVVPDLADRRAEIDRIFAAELAPGLAHIASSPAGLPFEFSLGHPLAETALAETALTLLRWIAGPLPLASIRSLLLSPFFGATGGPASPEALDTARFDAIDLPRLAGLQPELSLAQVAAHARDQSHAGLALRLQSTLHVARDLRLSTPAESVPRRSYGSWAESFRALLHAAGLGQPATSSSLTFQIFRSWDSALDQLATLDALAPEPAFAEVLDTLSRLLQQTIFAPAAREASVQILGPLELGGVPFDALWFLSADDLSWPVPARPQTLLPFALQRELGMPGTNVSRDRDLAQKLTRRIALSAGETVFSYARATEDGERRPSPVVRDLLTQLDAVSLPETPPPRHTPLPRLIVPDNTALPFLSGQVHGGAKVLELQAACPFRAVAELRLHSSEPGKSTLGLDAMESGSIVHVVMDHLWQQLHNQAELRALDATERSKLLYFSIDHALTEANREATGQWEKAYLHMQRQRLHTLLFPWLQIELQRAPFRVLELEQDRPWVRVGPIDLRLRIDRIDQLESGNEDQGGLVLIDYKTGIAEPSQWLGERPDAPQLPLYAVLPEAAQLAGVAFAQLRSGKDMKLKGFADDRGIFASTNLPCMDAEDLASQVELWRSIVNRLATEFAEGQSSVHPKSYPKTCKRCAQRPLCRLNPVLLDEWCDDTESSDGETEAETPAGDPRG
jgi:ATP-dependent helicase/nuclease subunit B